MAKYEKVENDAPFRIKMGDRALIMACCSCGLVHEYDFKLIGDELEITIRRDERKTALVRRHGDCDLMKDPGKFKMVRI